MLSLNEYLNKGEWHEIKCGNLVTCSETKTKTKIYSLRRDNGYDEQTFTYIYCT